MKELGRRIVERILMVLSRWTLRKYNPEIIAISGSIGKTSARDAIYRVLSAEKKVWYDVEGYNNRLGAELAILGIKSGGFSVRKWVLPLVRAFGMLIGTDDYPDIVLSVLSSDRPGTVDDVLKFVPLTHAVITNIGKTNLEYFSDMDQMRKEHERIVNKISATGHVVLNVDDVQIRLLKDKVRARIISFGKEEQANLMAEIDEAAYILDVDRWIRENGRTKTNLNFKVFHRGVRVPVRLPNMIGLHSVYSALVAISIGIIYNISLEVAASKLIHCRPPKGRLNLIRGIKNTLIIDATYSACELSVLNALESLKRLKASGRKIFVLGDMQGLGVYTEQAHRVVGEKAARVADCMLTLGVNTEFCDEGFLQAGGDRSNCEHFSSLQALTRFLAIDLRENDVILFCASKNILMERVVAKLMAAPNQVPNVLVRQGPRWKDVQPKFS